MDWGDGDVRAGVLPGDIGVFAAVGDLGDRAGELADGGDSCLTVGDRAGMAVPGCCSCPGSGAGIG